MLEDNIILGYITRIFRLDLPELETMEEYLDFILTKVGKLSTNLNNSEVFTEGKYWMEIRDEDEAHETILHMFAPPEDEGGSSKYMYSIDGNMLEGSWSLMGGGTILINALNHELFDLVFLNPDFLILQKHGNHGGAKYLLLASEEKVSKQYEWYDVLGRRRDQVKLEWRDIMELLFDIHRYNQVFVFFIVGAIVFVFIIAFFST